VANGAFGRIRSNKSAVTIRGVYDESSPDDSVDTQDTVGASERESFVSRKLAEEEVDEEESRRDLGRR
jgi:hypothetical protein